MSGWAIEVVDGMADSGTPSEFPEHLRHRIAQGLAALGREGEDPETTHDRRVAARRLRVAVSLLAPWVEEGQADRAGDRLKAVTRSLGRVREWDVTCELLLRLREGSHSDLERAGWEHLESLAERARGRALRRMTDEDTAKALRRATKAVEALLGSPIARDDEGALPGMAWAYLLPRLKAGFGPLPSLALQEDPDAMHAARTALKELRYGLEHLAPVFHGDLQVWLGRIRALQEALGQHHDWVVLAEWLDGVRMDLAASGRTALASGLAQGRLSLREVRAMAHAAFAASVPAAALEELQQDLWVSLGPWNG